MQKGKTMVVGDEGVVLLVEVEIRCDIMGALKVINYLGSSSG